MLCVSNLCFSFLEEFLEKEEVEGVDEFLVNWHMGQILYQVLRYCTLVRSRERNTALVSIDFMCNPTLYKQATGSEDKC